MEKTLFLIKPGCIREKCAGNMIMLLEKNDFTIAGMKMLKMTRDEAENFYYRHRGKPSFSGLVETLTSHNSLFLVLEGENIVEKAVRFAETAGTEVQASDSCETARFEVNYIFPELS